jgi:PHP family Zn ribbon phosphoesterase
MFKRAITKTISYESLQSYILNLGIEKEEVKGYKILGYCKGCDLLLSERDMINENKCKCVRCGIMMKMGEVKLKRDIREESVAIFEEIELESDILYIERYSKKNEDLVEVDDIEH